MALIESMHGLAHFNHSSIIWTLLYSDHSITDSLEGNDFGQFIVMFIIIHNEVVLQCYIRHLE